MGFQAIPKMPTPKGQPRPPTPSPKGGGGAPTPKGGQPATPKDIMRQRIAQQQQSMQQQQQSFAPSKPMPGRATPKSGMIR